MGGKKPISLEEAKQRIYDKHGNKIELLEFHVTAEKSHFKCTICDYDWWTTIGSVWKGHGCENCYHIREQGRGKFSYEYVKQFIESENCELLSKEYINCDSPIEVKFSCGHIGSTRFYNFRIGVRCDICAHKNNADHLRKDPNDVLQFLSENNFKFISFPNGYKNNKSKIRYECALGHSNECCISALLTNKSCRECSFIKMGENRLGCKGSNWQGGLTNFKKYIHQRITDWKRRSMEKCEFKSVITGGTFTDIHHLFSLSFIIKEALTNLKISHFKNVFDLSEKSLLELVEEIKRIHELHPLGVCIDRKSHTRFHQIYGKENNTPEQFYEFQSKIASGEIII
jgi:hypothetical protein